MKFPHEHREKPSPHVIKEQWRDTGGVNDGDSPVDQYCCLVVAFVMLLVVLLLKLLKHFEQLANC